jgi:hypothetical protein
MQRVAQSLTVPDADDFLAELLVAKLDGAKRAECRNKKAGASWQDTHET